VTSDLVSKLSQRFRSKQTVCSRFQSLYLDLHSWHWNAFIFRRL